MKTKLIVPFMLLATCLPLCAEEAQTTPPTVEDPCAFFNALGEMVALQDIASITKKITDYNQFFSSCAKTELHQLEYREWLLQLKALLSAAYDAATTEFASDETINAFLDLAKIHEKHAQMIVEQTVSGFTKTLDSINHTVKVLLQKREAVLKARDEKLAQEVGPEVAAKTIEEMNTLQGAVEPKTEGPAAQEAVAPTPEAPQTAPAV